jgi:uncharacterized protein (TIGR03084 family)
MQQALDFAEECDALGAPLESLQDWDRPTQFKRWSCNDILVHLHFWNTQADLSLIDPDKFQRDIAQILQEVRADGMRSMENRRVDARGPALLEQWRELYTDMSQRWAALDPRMRVQWAGPDMSVRSSMTARQMETWAHGQAVFDLIGQPREETDRIRNIVVLGVNTFAWSHQVRSLQVPSIVPSIKLAAPSGQFWQYGDRQSDNLIEGAAVEFAQVVTQTRNIADTSLRVTGEIARSWMASAQCFAGPPETPPAVATRFTQ